MTKDKKPTLEDLADAIRLQGFKSKFETHALLTDLTEEKIGQIVNFMENEIYKANQELSKKLIRMLYLRLTEQL